MGKRKRISCRTITIAAAFAASLFGATQSANATIIFTPGNHPQPNELNVKFNSGDTGTNILGEIGNTGINVTFTSSETLNAQGASQLINNAGGSLTNIDINVPGHTFVDFIFNLQTLVGSASISVTDNFGNVSVFDLAGSTGSNFLTITTANLELITDIAIDAPDGFDAFKQPRISGLDGQENPPSVPEPASLALLGSALLGYRLLRRRVA